MISRRAASTGVRWLAAGFPAKRCVGFSGLDRLEVLADVGGKPMVCTQRLGSVGVQRFKQLGSGHAIAGLSSQCRLQISNLVCQ